jgi:hypothetical protein
LKYLIALGIREYWIGMAFGYTYFFLFKTLFSI